MEQKIFREVENLRGREKRSTFIEHLIVLDLRNYAKHKSKKGSKNHRYDGNNPALDRCSSKP
jgi:hypothetical protein